MMGGGRHFPPKAAADRSTHGRRDGGVVQRKLFLCWTLHGLAPCAQTVASDGSATGKLATWPSTRPQPLVPHQLKHNSKYGQLKAHVGPGGGPSPVPLLTGKTRGAGLRTAVAKRSLLC